MIEANVSSHFLLTGAQSWAASVMASRACDETICRGPKDDDPFFDRWWLARKAVGEVENVYLHHFLRSDREDLHDHPWDNGSLVLRGSYLEVTPEGRFRRHRGDVVFRTAEQRHGILEVEPGTVTLFVTLRKRREWGFWPSPDLFVHHLEYAAWKARQTVGRAA
jgi:quercetin dioxygenase-like cupin family protein